LGRATALAFGAKGYRVFGTALRPEEIVDLREASGGAVSLTICDITDEGAVAAWAQEVADQTNGGLIQNAGTLTPGPLEALKLDAIKHEFNVMCSPRSRSPTHFCRPCASSAAASSISAPGPRACRSHPTGHPARRRRRSKAALEVIATIHCAELKPFGVEVVVAAPGNMRTGGPALVAEGLRKIAHDFTDEQRKLYGGSFGAFANRLNAMQGGGISAADAAAHVVEIAEETPAPIKAGVGEEAEEILRYVRETPPAKQDIRRLEMVGRRARLRPKTTTLDRKEQAMLVLVDPNDARAVNKDTILAMYDLLINTKKPMKAGVGPVYIQHNPLLVISAPPGSSRKSPPNVRTPASSSTRSSPSATMSGRT
jgi:NAD(P)-dependent dehydrogenase (short-subunit alcohol dehydrogenase family)